MNKLIIKAKEKFYLEHKSDALFLKLMIISSLILLVVRLYLLVSPLSIAYNYIRIFTLLSSAALTLSSLIVYAHAVFHNHIIPDIYIQDIFYLALHHILPGKKEREAEYLAFCEANPKITQRPEKELFIHQEIFKVSQNNLGEWINTHIGKEKSLYNLVVARCSDNSGFKKDLLYWSQLFPSKKLTLDDYRLMLFTNKIVSSEHLSELPPITKEEIEQFFINYDDKDIVKLFTSSYRIYDYFKILTSAKKHNLVLPVRKTISDLLFPVNESVAAIEGTEFHFKRNQTWISQLETECELGQIVMIDNVAMLDEWAQNMRNCIRSRRDKISQEKSYLFGVIKDSSPYLVFELNSKGRLVEAKKSANRELSREEMKTLQNILKSIST